MYTPKELRSLNRHDVTPTRAARKAIFSLRLWRPLRQRRRAQRLLERDESTRPFCTGANGLSFGCVNTRSIGNKAATLCRTIIDEHLDVLVITETWHEGAQSSALKRLTPPGYHCVDAARPISADAAVNAIEFHNHGGLAILYRDAVKFRRKVLDINVSTFEYVCGRGSTGDGQFVLLGVYRPGSQALSIAFFEELSTIFERLSMYNCPVVVCGDFNVHVDDSSCVYALRLAELLQSFGYVQHVTEATHTAGHILDLVITRSDIKITDVRVGDWISDHALVHFTVHLKKPVEESQPVTGRAWRRFKRDKFESDLAASELCTNLEALDNKSADDLALLYRYRMTQLLEKHCLIVKLRRKMRPATPWYDAETPSAVTVAGKHGSLRDATDDGVPTLTGGTGRSS